MRRPVCSQDARKEVETSMRAYSQDLREHVLRAVDQGHPRAEIVQLFGISPATLKRYIKQRREAGHVRPESDSWSASEETGTGGSWRAAPVTGEFRCHPGATL